jgi:hypothetical protein
LGLLMSQDLIYVYMQYFMSAVELNGRFLLHLVRASYGSGVLGVFRFPLPVFLPSLVTNSLTIPSSTQHTLETGSLGNIHTENICH